MRTLISLLVVFVLALSLNINGQDLALSDPASTIIIVDDYKITGNTYGQFLEIKDAVKQVNALKKNKHKYGIPTYKAMVSTVMSGLKLKGITVTTI